jgi:hypothetical protein
MVVLEQPAQPFPTTNRLIPASHWFLTRREQQHIALALMIPFLMKVPQVFSQHPPQRSLTKEDKL